MPAPFRRLVPPVLVSLLLAAVLAACAAPTGSSGATPPGATVPPATSPAPAATGSPTAAAQPTFPLTVTDDEGRPVTLKAIPQRIVSLTPGTTETAFALGLGSRVVAVTSSDDYPPAVKSLPQVATYLGVDIEKVVGLRPDIVLAGGNGLNKPADLQKLRDLGIPVLVVYAKDVPGVLADIRLVGTALGEGPRAAELTAAMQQQLDSISAAATADQPLPRVFYELDASDQIYGPAPQSFVAGMVALAGGVPITTDNPAVFSISLEKLVAADPQVIVLGDFNYGTTPAQVAKRPGWEGMTAVRDGAVRPVDDTVVTRPGPRLADGLRDLALAIHPDLRVPSPAPLPAWTSPST